MNLELVGALNELERERGISKDILVEAIEAAIVSAYKRHYGAAENVRVQLDQRTGRMRVFAQKDVVEEVMDEATEISLDAARAIDESYKLHDLAEIEITPRDFGRIAAGTAKQVVFQRIRDAERNLVYEEYANRIGDIVTGIVQRMQNRTAVIDLGRTEANLVPGEQMPGENYATGARVKVYITDVQQTNREPRVFISRTHPGLLKRLFELEVPEIHDGIVEIKAVAREAGNRSKIAVYSHDPNVDPVGACVGPRGTRVQAVVQELRGEKIDIVEWWPEQERFVANALSPAKVVQVFLNATEKTARAVVPDHQLSLAIGKEGQNARLAARLSGWKIDIKSESQMAELAVLEAQRAFEEAEEALKAKRAAEALAAEAEQQAPEEGAAPEVAEVAAEALPPELADVELPPELIEEVLDLPPTEDEEEVLDGPELAAEMLEEPFEELEPELPAPRRRARAPRRELEEDFLDEAVLDDDVEELPTLFGADDDLEDFLEEDLSADEDATVYVVGPDEEDSPLSHGLAAALGQLAGQIRDTGAEDDEDEADASEETKSRGGKEGAR